MLKPKYLIMAAVAATAIIIARFALPPAAVFQSPSWPDSSAAIELAPSVNINSLAIPVEVVRESQALQKGLSGRASLEAERGMLFVFPKPDRYRFWMPDMRFPLDIIWIAGGKIIAIDENVPPESDAANPRFYTPPQPVTHVLEVNAGFTKSQNLNIGDAVVFNGVENR